MEKRKSDPSFDKKVDKKLIEIVKKGGTVITSYTLPTSIKMNPSSSLSFGFDDRRKTAPEGWPTARHQL